MKIPKHITDALGRPRCVCPSKDCGALAQITAKGTIAQHRRRLDPFLPPCSQVGQSAPDGAALEWVREEMESHRKRAEEFRTEAERATKSAEHCGVMAAELEKVIVRESGKGTDK